MRDFRVLFMGHKGDIEHRYTLNRHRLALDLETTTPVSVEDDVPTKIQTQIFSP